MSRSTRIDYYYFAFCFPLFLCFDSSFSKVNGGAFSFDLLQIVLCLNFYSPGKDLVPFYHFRRDFVSHNLLLDFEDKLKKLFLMCQSFGAFIYNFEHFIKPLILQKSTQSVK